MTHITARFASRMIANSRLATLAGVALMAGAVALVAPQRADAQVRFGVSVGIPVHGGPVYGRPYGPPVVYGPPRYVAPAPVYGGYDGGGYYGPRHLSHEEWFRRQAYWQREHGYYR